MDDFSQPMGCLMDWKTSPGLQRLPQEDRTEIFKRSKHILAKARAKGLMTFGNYNCRWSSDFDYFTFWLSPDLKTIQRTFEELERVGLFRLVEIQSHLGVQGSGDKHQDQGHLLTPEALQSVAGNPDRPLGFYALWRRTACFYRASPKDRAASSLAVTEVFDYARQIGVITFGRYDCRSTSEWKFFTFWLAPSFDMLEPVFDRLENAGDFIFAEPIHRMGLLEPQAHTLTIQ